MKRLISLLFSLVFMLSIANAETATVSLQELYAQAELLMVQGNYGGAAAKFEQLSAYSDAAQMTLYCKAVYAADMGMYAMAVDALNSMGQFKDAPQLARYYTACSYLEYVKSKSEHNLVNYEAYRELWSENILKVFEDSKYHNISEELKYCEWAKEIFSELALYKDSLMKIEECNMLILGIQAANIAEKNAEKEKKYQEAIAQETENNYKTAISLYKELGNYKDCVERYANLNKSIYQQAIIDEEKGNLENALDLFNLIKEYQDSNKHLQSLTHALTTKYESVFSFHDGIAIATTPNGHDYYIDKRGIPIFIEFNYDQLHNFSEGYAIVQRNKRSGINYDFYYTYVDTSGNIVIPEFKAGGAYGFHDGFARIRTDIKKKDGSISGYEYHYIDKQGKISSWGTFINAGDFFNGLALAVDKNKELYILNALDGTKTPFSEKFPDILRVRYPSANDSNILVYGVYRNTSTFIDSSGKRISDKMNFNEARDFHEGYAAVLKDNLWGFVDPQMQLIVPHKWQEVRNFSNGMAAVYNGSKWGFINTSGEEVIPCQWDYVADFHDGQARVFCGTLNKRGNPNEGKWGYIDQTGQLTISCEWDAAADFNEGLACVLKDGYLTVFDTEGNQID